MRDRYGLSGDGFGAVVGAEASVVCLRAVLRFRSQPSPGGASQGQSWRHVGAFRCWMQGEMGQGECRKEIKRKLGRHSPVAELLLGSLTGELEAVI